MSKRKPHSLRARVERSCRALLSSNHVAVVNIDPSGSQAMFNWKNCKRITSLKVANAIFEVAYNWTVYIGVMCIDQRGGEYIKSVEIAPQGMYKVDQLTDAIEHCYLELRDSCNQQHLVASGWIAIPSALSLDEAQAALLFNQAGAWNQVKAA
ncbi:MAG TPA: hypothetical protein VGC62_19080 [Pseudomonas sp.]|uniref:hypothetical protein n=1 Tax=Pseudomonas sp. TaxID=306 RepID=UPI002EDB4597